MRTSTVHLEKALAEFNSKVDDLSRREDSIELLDALINRGAVLSMLDYVTSAKEDFDDAILLMDRLAGKGVAIDAGYYVRAYVSRAELYPEGEEESALADYQKAIGHLADLRPGSKYYDKKNIAEMCSISTQSIGDLERLSLARPFIDKGLEMTSGEDSSFSKTSAWVCSTIRDMRLFSCPIIKRHPKFFGILQTRRRPVCLLRTRRSGGPCVCVCF